MIELELKFQKPAYITKLITFARVSVVTGQNGVSVANIFCPKMHSRFSKLLDYC